MFNTRISKITKNSDSRVNTRKSRKIVIFGNSRSKNVRKNAKIIFSYAKIHAEFGDQKSPQPLRGCDFWPIRVL